MLMLRKIVFFLFLFVGLSLFAQQDYLVSSYVRGNFYNRGRVATESLRASDDLIFLNVHPNKDGTLSFENPRAFQGNGVTTWEGLIKSVRAKVKGTKAKIRLGASSGEWKAMVADEAARTAFAKNIKTVLEKNKLDGIDLDFEWAENEKEYKDYSLAILKMREVLGDKYLFSVSLHPVCYKISKEAIEAVDFISLQCYGPSPVRFPIEKYCSDIQMVLEYGIPKEKLVAGVVNCATNSLSGANTIKVTPNMVSARVVKIVNSRSLSFTLNCTSAPSERPIQFLWVSFRESVHSIVSNPSSKRCAYADTRKHH